MNKSEDEGSKMKDSNNTAAPTRLTEQPARRGQQRLGALLIILGGCLLLLIGVGILVWQFVGPGNTDTSTGARNTPTSVSQTGKQPAGCTGARQPIDVIQQQTAQGLHLTVAQVQARVLAGKKIAQIATDQGLTASQLHNVELQALRTANSRWQSLGCITPQDVQDNLRRDTGAPSYMDEEFTSWFKG